MVKPWLKIRFSISCPRRGKEGLRTCAGSNPKPLNKSRCEFPSEVEVSDMCHLLKPTVELVAIGEIQGAIELAMGNLINSDSVF